MGAYAGRGRYGDKRREADHGVVVTHRDDRGMAARVLVDPRHLLGERPGHEVEGHRRLEHLDVVDVSQGFGVPTLGQAGPVHGGARYALGLSSSGLAPLAQSAEHFHGKEGVYGSSP